MPDKNNDAFEARLTWLDQQVGLLGRQYLFQRGDDRCQASLLSIREWTNAPPEITSTARHLEPGGDYRCTLALDKQLPDTFGSSSFALLDPNTRQPVAEGDLLHRLRRASNIHRQVLSISREHREGLNGHQGKVIWFTGLSGAGKSTIANALEQRLHALGFHTYLLDGDNVRHGLNKDLGFSEADRVENIRRIAEVARLMLDAGLVVLTAFISPFRQDRQTARELVGAENFIEVHVATPLEVCEQRDPKGLYKKARRGELPNLTGIGSPYEPPLTPEIRLHSERSTLPQMVDILLASLI